MRIAMTMTLALLLTSCGGEEDFFDPNGNPVDTQLASGYWRLDYARTVDDDCFPESPDSRTSLVSYLPEGFMVDASTGSFQIEAVDYGTEGPVTCTLSGADFTCQPQRATPALGWTYQIVFSGGSAHLNRFKDRPRSNTLGSTPTTKRPSAVPVSILRTASQTCFSSLPGQIGTMTKFMKDAS